jgi:hypothetical protein
MLAVIFFHAIGETPTLVRRFWGSVSYGAWVIS